MANCKTANTDTTEQTILNQLRDISHLQIPLKLSDTVDKFLKAIEDGTNEVKFLLTKECDLLVECKVIRNMKLKLKNYWFFSVFLYLRFVNKYIDQ